MRCLDGRTPLHLGTLHAAVAAMLRDDKYATSYLYLDY